MATSWSMDDFLASFDDDDDEAAAPMQRQASARLYAVSDVHTDYAENLAWCRSLADGSHFTRDTLILAGDVSHSPDVLRETLQLLASAFDRVFFTPGNHDIWTWSYHVSPRSAPLPGAEDSLSRLAEALALCEELGVQTTPGVAAGAIVVPVLAWHHLSWDTEPDITGWQGIPPCELVMSDFRRTAFPSHMPCGSDSCAAHFDALNDVPAPLASRVDALRAVAPGAPVVSFSHFVPYLELVPEKRYLNLPSLHGAVGSRYLGARLEALRPDMHVFGHTHFGWDAVREGIRYVQAPLSYPAEREGRLTTVGVGEDFLNPARAPEPLLVYDAVGGFPPRYDAAWSNFYTKYARDPQVTHRLADYVAPMYKMVPGVGDVGLGGRLPAWEFGPAHAKAARAERKRTEGSRYDGRG